MNDAYLSGIIDGEGCLLIHKELRQRNKNFPPCLNYIPRISVGMTSRPVIKLLCRRFGGCFIVEKKKDGRRQMFKWTIQNFRSVLDCLNAIEPFLVEKKRQAKVLRKLADRKGRQNGRQRLTEKELKERERLFGQIKKLKYLD